jgi:hypothetical protein
MPSVFLQKTLNRCYSLKHAVFWFPFSIACDTMTRNKLKKLVQRVAEMRHSPQKAIDLQRLARQLGRRKVVRGKEPAWESIAFPALSTLTIPYHAGKDLAVGTKNSLLAQLQKDLDAWEEQLSREEGDQVG